MSVLNRIQILLLTALILLGGCHPRCELLEPRICYNPPARFFKAKDSIFEPLTPEEQNAEWGKEYYIARIFASDNDLYRAITTFKRSLYLMSDEISGRCLQVEFDIILCYYLGRKYQEALNTFEYGKISTVTSQFPAFRDLLVILYECYLRTDQLDKACTVMSLMEKGDPDTALDLKIFTTVDSGCLMETRCLAEHHPNRNDIDLFICQYEFCAKSVRTAQILNGILPGAGYYYVGQKKSALTSFLINAAFIAAAYHFFDNGNWGAGIITTSLEMGWYFGGINGAGLAAKEYNQILYERLGKNLMAQKDLFPVLMLQTSF